MLCVFLGMIERWETLASRVEQAQMASALHRELAAMRAEFKATHDRLFDYEIVLEQPHVLDDRINGITVSFFSYLPVFVTLYIHACVHSTVVSKKARLRITSEASRVQVLYVKYVCIVGTNEKYYVTLQN